MHVKFFFLIVFLFTLSPPASLGQGTLLRGKLKLNKKDEVQKLKGIKLFTDFREGSLWVFFDVDRGRNVQNWLINSEPWGSIRLENDLSMKYYGRAEMGQSFVEIESWIDTVSKEANWVIKSLDDVFFLRKVESDVEIAYTLLRQIVTDKGRIEVPLIDFMYDPQNPKYLEISDEAPLSDYPLLMKVIAAWLASLESLGQLKVLEG